VVLLGAEGMKGKEIAKMVGISAESVSRPDPSGSVPLRAPHLAVPHQAKAARAVGVFLTLRGLG
jgi:hypothetical protein